MWGEGCSWHCPFFSYSKFKHVSYMRDFLFGWVWVRQGPPPSMGTPQGLTLHFPVDLASRAQTCYLISITKPLLSETFITSWRSDPKIQGQRLFITTILGSLERFISVIWLCFPKPHPTLLPILLVNLISCLSQPEMVSGNFPGRPVVKTLCFQCQEYRFNPWLRD